MLAAIARLARTRRSCRALPCALAAGLPLVLAAAPAHPPPDPELTRLTRLWERERFSEALPGLLQFRKRGTDARYRNLDVDFMIATSTCRVPQTVDLGVGALKRVLQLYRLDLAGRSMVEEEIRRGCPPGAGAARLRLSRLRERASGTERGPQVIVSGKSAFDPDAAEETARTQAGSGEAPASVGPTAEQLAARLFPRERAAQAVRSVRRLAGEGYSVVEHGPFVLASRRHTEPEMKTIGELLTRYLDFYAATFEMRRPGHLITVYLAGDVAEMRDLASRLHGLDLSSTSIGYSVHDDLSIVAWIPELVSGTLMHELFHLAVREDFGDVPPWLDEGVAALYEVSEIGSPGAVRGVPNWRGPILSARFDRRPTIARLVAADWATFDSLDGSQTQQAVNHATARYFALFLQENGALPAVYRAFRARDVFAADQSAADPVTLLERATGRSAAELDAAFDAWFRTLPG